MMRCGMPQCTYITPKPRRRCTYTRAMLPAARALCDYARGGRVVEFTDAMGALGTCASALGPVAINGAERIQGYATSMFTHGFTVRNVARGDADLVEWLNATPCAHEDARRIMKFMELLCVWCGLVTADDPMNDSTPVHAAWGAYATVRRGMSMRARTSAMWALTGTPALCEITSTPERWAAEVAVLHAAVRRVLEVLARAQL